MMTNFLAALQSTLIQASIIGSLTIFVIGLLDRVFPASSDRSILALANLLPQDRPPYLRPIRGPEDRPI